MNEITPQQEMEFQREMQERTQASDPNAIYADSMREDKLKNIIAQLNPELLLTEIEHRIRGEKRNPYTDDWEPIGKESKISELLVQNYIAFLNVYLTQNNSLSNFSANEINNIMAVVIEYIRDDLSDNSYTYGLTKREEIKVKSVHKVLLKQYNAKEGYYYYREYPIVVEELLPIGEEYTDYNQFNKIGHIVCQSTFSVLKQAQNGMLASRVFKALRVNETIGQGGQKSKWDVLKFW